MKFDWCNGRVFSAYFGLECDKGNGDTVDIFELNLLRLSVSVTCKAIKYEDFECGKRDAVIHFLIAIFWFF